MLNKSRDKEHVGLVPVFWGTLLVLLHSVSAALGKAGYTITPGRLFIILRGTSPQHTYFWFYDAL